MKVLCAHGVAFVRAYDGVMAYDNGNVIDVRGEHDAEHGECDQRQRTCIGQLGCGQVDVDQRGDRGHCGQNELRHAGHHQ